MAAICVSVGITAHTMISPSHKFPTTAPRQKNPREAPADPIPTAKSPGVGTFDLGLGRWSSRERVGLAAGNYHVETPQL